MIDINTYRFRIGTFNIVCSGQKSSFQNKDSKNFIIIWTLSLNVLCFLLFSSTELYFSSFKEDSTRIYTPVSRITKNGLEKDAAQISLFSGDVVEFKEGFRAVNSKCLPNFLAKYKFGNKKDQKRGIVCYHLNIRSLRNKVNEV